MHCLVRNLSPFRINMINPCGKEVTELQPDWWGSATAHIEGLLGRHEHSTRELVRRHSLLQEEL